ncbi:DUF2939 domain-containing protein [Rhodovibrio sodomensis]|nr:DUF2939 domain-containing protein [Rhodovibrio sodomensis]
MTENEGSGGVANHLDRGQAQTAATGSQRSGTGGGRPRSIGGGRVVTALGWVFLVGFSGCCWWAAASADATLEAMKRHDAAELSVRIDYPALQRALHAQRQMALGDGPKSGMAQLLIDGLVTRFFGGYSEPTAPGLVQQIKRIETQNDLSGYRLKLEEGFFCRGPFSYCAQAGINGRAIATVRMELQDFTWQLTGITFNEWGAELVERLRL